MATAVHGIPGLGGLRILRIVGDDARPCTEGQTLGWTTPRPRHPAQADRWTWLVLAASTQLRLARQIATDARLPWEVPRPQPRLSPYRVRRGFPRLLCVLGSPAAAPKPSGCSPGRPKGRPSGPATRYPATKKPAKKPPTTAKAA